MFSLMGVALTPMLTVLILGCASFHLVHAERPPSGTGERMTPGLVQEPTGGVRVRAMGAFEASSAKRVGEHRLDHDVQQHNFSDKAAVASLVGGSFIQQDRHGGPEEGMQHSHSAPERLQSASSTGTSPTGTSPTGASQSESGNAQQDANASPAKPGLAITQITTEHATIDDPRETGGKKLPDSGSYNEIKRILQGQEETVFTRPAKVKEYSDSGHNSIEKDGEYEKSLATYIQGLLHLDKGASIVTQKEYIAHDHLAHELSRLLHDGRINFDHLKEDQAGEWKAKSGGQEASAAHS